MFVARDTRAIKSAGCIFVEMNFFAASTDRSICSGSIAEKSKKSSISRRSRASSDGGAFFPLCSSVPCPGPAAPETVASAAPAAASSSTFSKSNVEICCFFPSSKSVKSSFLRSLTRLPFLSCATTFTRTSSVVTSMRASFPPACPACWAIREPAECKSRPAAAKAETILLVRRICIFLQNRKRACIVTRRMLAVPVISPKVNEFTAVLSAVKFTLLNTLFAEIRRSSARDSLI